ncbi:DUF6228 family protein [Streptomyces lasiicapitis]|uniref:DUF6228 family protein n=1 Tax=Streptomyces lasiicapitis TaxID=1923961 RepID=UPI0036658BDD
MPNRTLGPQDSRSDFRSGGYIGLTWTLRPWPRAAGCWTASVTTWLEAGEQLASVGADARRFFGAERP